MKTTMNLPDALMEAVKNRAAAEKRTQTSVIEEAIRRLLLESDLPPYRPMPVYGTPGTNPLLVPLEDKQALYDLLDEGDSMQAARDQGAA